MASDERPQYGRKRPAEGDPDGAQPLTKRFGRLQLDVESDRQNSKNPFPHCPPIQPQHNDSMLLDDTKHTTYIHDLDRELIESDSPPGALILMPLAERMLTVPESILNGDHDTSQGKELVLYTEPSSLSVPREQDSVRKAIIESRARARALKTQQSSHSDKPSVPVSLHTTATTTTTTTSDLTNGFDDDPMDIDGDS